MRDRLKLPRAYIALILAGSARIAYKSSSCREERLGELNGAPISQAEVSAHRY
jgi:hypothetical protein